VDAEVVGAGVAAAIAVEACQGIETAGLKRLAEDVFGCGGLLTGRHGLIVVERRAISS
jgi:hypothetical protein